MFRIGRFLVLSAFLVSTALAGVVTGVLIAPASGEVTRLRVSAFFERHAYLKENVRRSARAVADAVEDARAQVFSVAEAAVSPAKTED